VLREAFGPKREELAAEWTKLHNKKHNELYFFLISFHCTTSLITDYKYTYVTINGGCGACGMREVKGNACTGLWWGNQRKQRGMDGRVILKWILQKQDGRVWAECQARDK